MFEGIKDWFSENVVRRKVFFFGGLLAIWLLLLGGAYFSPQRQVYTNEQLTTKQSFVNGTGDIEITSQVYSPSTGIIVLQLETTDATSSLGRGIDSKRLNWQIYSPNPSENTTMEVVPVTDKKLSVIIRNVPENFGVFAIDVTNKTVSSNLVDVDIASSSSEEKKHLLTSSSEGDDTVQFYIATQNKKLKTKEIKSVTREEFALSELANEKAFQKGQVKKLNDAIKQLKASIADDESSKASLQEEAKYLAGDDLEDNQTNITNLDNSIKGKNEQIDTANDNLEKVDERIKALEKKEAAIKDGSFEFSSPVQTVKLN